MTPLYIFVQLKASANVPIWQPPKIEFLLSLSHDHNYIFFSTFHNALIDVVMTTSLSFVKAYDPS